MMFITVFAKQVRSEKSAHCGLLLVEKHHLLPSELSWLAEKKQRDEKEVIRMNKRKRERDRDTGRQRQREG